MENDVKRMKTNMVASVDCLAASAESKTCERKIHTGEKTEKTNRRPN